MLEYFYKLIVIGVFLFFGNSICIAQQEPKPKKIEEGEPQKEKKPKEKEKLKLSSIRVGTELLHLINTAVSNNVKGFELNGDIGFNNRYFAVVDFGNEKYIRSNEVDEYEYQNNGSYVRAGFDYNMLYQKTASEALTFGLRYGTSSFNHKFTYVEEDDFWGASQQYTVEDSKLSASWVELVVAFKVELFKNIYLSPNLRLKFLAGKSDTQYVNIAEIPGYGNTKSNTRVNINYTLLYKLPVKKKK
ncbi:DUF6048 family protein [Chondrinema litorale]|uniref:DUF6048 family protein n=1 Tax=Chondrinema litorale TaxID=2994555 RepID=UPI002542ED28|nr:DUF6048 family protein [Chondrinema litorale]UZR95871.1 DUF6048 family protein [Chondrinema litorale]